MDVVPKNRTQSARRLSREELCRLAQEIDARSGIVGEPTMTLSELHESMRAHGVRPEDNAASRDLMRMRYGDDWDQDK